MLNQNFFVEYHNLSSDERYGNADKQAEWDARIKNEIERLNPLLLSLLPTLRERLKAKVGDELAAWLQRGQSKAVIPSKEEAYAESLIEAIQEYASESYHLDMKGYDGFVLANALSPEDLQSVLATIDSFINSRMSDNGLKRLIAELEQGVYNDEAKEDAIFFVWAAMLEDGASGEVAYLWILESGLYDRFDYMFTIEEGAQLNQVWRICEDVLPPEIIPALDLDYI